MKKSLYLLTAIILSLFLLNSHIYAQALGPQPTAYHTVGLNADGTVYAWGYNGAGQLGDNSTTDKHVPIKVLEGDYEGTDGCLGDDSGNKIITVALGTRHSVALAEDGTVYTWGYNCFGQLGDNSTIQRITPVNVSNESGDGDLSLPVELSSFIVESTQKGVLCKWTTESETENLGFILERRTEDTNWTEIASYKTDEGLLGQGSTPSATDYEYLDVYVEPNTTYEYRLADVDYDGLVTYHATRTVTLEQILQSSISKDFTVLPAYPNPFNPSTTIRYGLDADSKVTVAIYDITGHLISTLQEENQAQGWHSVIWNGTNQQGTQVPAGLYFSRITSNNDVKTSKLMMLK